MKIGFMNKKLTHFLQFCREMDYDSNNTVPPASAQVATPTMAQVPLMPTIVPIFVSPREKPEKFNRLNFKRWQRKMLFYFAILNLTRFLTKDTLKLKEDEYDIQVISAMDTWKNSNFLCKNHVKNALTDSLYNVYSNKNTVKEL